jgi:hypothetical protein
MRNPVSLTLLVGLSALAAACSCREPELPGDDNTDTDPQSTADTATTPTADTGPEPLCDAPEVEPNDTINEPTDLPMDRLGCGGFDEEGDFDHWRFSLNDDGWLAVRVEANDGSLANVAVILSGNETDVAASRDQNEEDEDVHLLLPVPADDYIVNVREEAGKAGERYTYEILASVAKEPEFFDEDGAYIDWFFEAEPNDDPALAPDLRNGDAILGFSDVQFDVDYYAVAVPPGRHELIFEVQAYAKGSAGDFVLTLFDSELNELKRRAVGQLDYERDPYLHYFADGDELLYIQVRDEDSRGNEAMWYLLTTSIEAL